MFSVPRGCNARTFMQNSQHTGQWMAFYLWRHLPCYLRTKLLVGNSVAELLRRSKVYVLRNCPCVPFVSAVYNFLRFFMFLKLFGDLAGVQFFIGPTWEERVMIAFAPQELPCQEHLCGSAGLAAPGLLGSIWWWWRELVSVAIR